MGALPPPPRNLNVVITGGSVGIGRSIVDKFASQGHRVLFTYLTSTTSASLLESRFSQNVTKTRLDQGDVASVARFAAIVDNWAGIEGVDVLINNAALGSATVDKYVQNVVGKLDLPNGHSPMNGTLKKESSIQKMLKSAVKDEALMRVNALGPLWVTQALMDSLDRAKKGVVVFIGSVGGGSHAVFPEYCPADLMSKAAVTYLTKHMAAQYVKDKLDVVCVAPGATETEMFRKSTLDRLERPLQFMQQMPKRRLIQPDDVADLVYWVAVKAPQSILHGAVLDASMGLAVRPGLQTESESNT